MKLSKRDHQFYFLFFVMYTIHKNLAVVLLLEFGFPSVASYSLLVTVVSLLLKIPYTLAFENFYTMSHNLSMVDIVDQESQSTLNH